MTPTEARRLLEAHGLAPRKADGQNFLVDPNTVRRIVSEAGLRPDDHVVEVGPGLGAMTSLLLDEVETVTAIELDAGLVEVVVETLGHHEQLRVIHADAMDVDLDALPGPRPLRLVANLPYNVATPLVLHAFSGRDVASAWVMVQREVAARWVADVGDPAYGAVSIKLALVAERAIGAAIPRSVFWPRPNVDSVMVRLDRRADAPDPNRRAIIGTVVDVAFRQRRKTLRNNLRRTWPDAAVSALEASGIDPGLRAEALPADALVRLTDALAARTTIEVAHR